MDINYQELMKFLVGKKSHEDITDEIYPLEESDIELINQWIDSLDPRDKFVIKNLFNVDRPMTEDLDAKFIECCQTIRESAGNQLHCYFDKYGIWNNFLKYRYRNELLELITENNQLFYELLKVANILDQEDDLSSFDVYAKLSEIKKCGSEKEFFEEKERIARKNLNDLLGIKDRWRNLTSIYRLIKPSQVIETIIAAVKENIITYKDIKDFLDRIDIPIEDMNFTVRTFNVLSHSGIETLAQLHGYSEKELLKIRNLGAKSLEEIKNGLAKHNLELKK